MLKPPVTREQIEKASLKLKIKAGKEVVKRALEKHDVEKTVIGFTGGKDSTLTAWLVKKVCEEEGIEKPDFMFIDHGQHFKEIEEYVVNLAEDWGFDVKFISNDDIIEKADEPGDLVPVEELDERNRKEVKRVDSSAENAPWLMDTEIGNHLLKTVPMNRFIENKNIKAVINGVRWDEHESRGDEDFYSPRAEPEHLRVHPILQFSEREVWEVTWFHMVPDILGVKVDEFPEKSEDLPDGISVNGIPISPKYWQGFRSLGSEVSTEKSDEKPAWLQDLDNTKERAGRAQNKDEKEIMNRLRELGYM